MLFRTVSARQLTDLPSHLYNPSAAPQKKKTAYKKTLNRRNHFNIKDLLETHKNIPVPKVWHRTLDRGKRFI